MSTPGFSHLGKPGVAALSTGLVQIEYWFGATVSWRVWMAGEKTNTSADNPRVKRPRPERLWPTDALELAETLATGGANLAD